MPNQDYGVTRFHFADREYAIPLRYVPGDEPYPLEAERLPGIQQAEFTMYGFELTPAQLEMYQRMMAAPHTPMELQPISEETRQRREAERLRRLEEIRLATVAEEKARETLKRMLTKDQLKEWDCFDRFTIVGSEGHRFQIGTYSYSGNIAWVDKTGRTRGVYCCHPHMRGTDLDGSTGKIPLCDALIAQKLMLETDEIGFMRTTVVNWGDVPKKAKDHVENLPRGQYCRCPSSPCSWARSMRQW